MLNEILNNVKEIQKQFSKEQKYKIEQYKNKSIEITCHKGCGFCCNMSVKTNLLEALALYHMINQNSLDKLRVISNKIVEIHKKNDEENFFYIYRKEIGDCIFLNKNICSVHKYRPITCRSVLSNHPKELCHYNFAENIDKEEMKQMLKSMDNKINEDTPYIIPFIYLADIYEEQIKSISQKYFNGNISGNLIILLNLIRENKSNSNNNLQKIFLDVKKNNFPKLLIELS